MQGYMDLVFRFSLLKGPYLTDAYEGNMLLLRRGQTITITLL